MKITESLALEMLNSGNEKLIAAAKEAYPTLVKSNFEVACETLGIPPIIPEGLSTAMQAMYQLEKIIQVANDGWIPNIYDRSQYKYSPYFTVVDGEFVFGYVCGWYSVAAVPAPSLIKSREVAEQIALENIHLYKQMLCG